MGKKKGNSKLIGQFRYITDLRIPGFLKSVPPGSVGQLDLIRRTSFEWYSSFLSEIDSAIGKRYLPIYRMADGEFIFCVGRRLDLLPVGATWQQKIRHIVKAACPPFILEFLRKPKGGLLNEYDVSQKKRVEEEVAIGKSKSGREHYLRCIRTVSTNGFLALHFTRSPGRFSEQYYPLMCKWFDANDIQLSEQNYAPFYFIYALLCGPDAKRIIQERRILVVTSANTEKRDAIRSSLHKLGASNVEFIHVSPTKAILDRIDLSNLHGKVDIALVGAGIGAVNILEQMRSLHTLCIDAGFFIEILANHHMRSRIFTIPDALEDPVL